MLEIAVCDDDIADLECAVTMLHKIFTSQKIAYHIEQFASANQMLENISNIDIGIFIFPLNKYKVLCILSK